MDKLVEAMAKSSMSIYRKAYDEGYKKGFSDGKIQGLKQAEEIIERSEQKG